MHVASPWLTVEEAAGHLKLSKSYIKKEIAAGRLPHRRVGRRILINRAQIDVWVNGKPGVSAEAVA
jgi:excisionase family DNA binding protein